MSNIEFVYKLNLPLLSEILTPDFYSSILSLNDKIKLIYQTIKTKDRIKQEFLNSLGYEFDYMNIFLKKNFKGKIHSDSVDDTDMWAINWVNDGIGIMEFWSLENLWNSPEMFKDSLGLWIRRFDENLIKNPIKIYRMDPGAYLVNVSAIHRATGIGPRCVISLRPTIDKSMKWPDVIKSFQHIIVGIPEQIDCSSLNKIY